MLTLWHVFITSLSSTYWFLPDVLSACQMSRFFTLYFMSFMLVFAFCVGCLPVFWFVSFRIFPQLRVSGAENCRAIPVYLHLSLDTFLQPWTLCISMMTMHACNLLYLRRLVYHQQFVTSGSLKIEVLCYVRGLTLLHQDPQQIATDFPISLLHKTWTLTCCKLKLQRHVTTCYAVKQKSSEWNDILGFQWRCGDSSVSFQVQAAAL